ncbi:MAG: hypothetical protein IKD69_00005, partial [Solobacterium sp.]|nr:hypothetical protein [Solobacterium sp.]
MKRKTQVKWTNTANEINRRIEDNFQGRLDEIRIFHERTNYLVNHMHSDSLVTNYYGFGGIGKTWLLKRLEEEAGKRGSGFVRYEFDTISTDSAGATLLSLAFSIGKAYGGHIWDRTIDLLKKYGSDGSILEQDFSKAEKTYDAAGKAVNAGLKIAAFSVPGSQILQVLTVINKNYKILKSLRKSGLIIAGQFDSKEYDTAEGTYDNEETLARELADAFCADLKILLAGLERPLVIALDGLDRFYKNNTDDAWLKQIIMDLDDIHWILAGRDRLNWEEEVWTAEAEDNMPHLLPVQLGALSEEETKTYFCRAEVVREEDNDFSEYLYQLTDGIP